MLDHSSFTPAGVEREFTKPYGAQLETHALSPIVTIRQLHASYEKNQGESGLISGSNGRTLPHLHQQGQLAPEKHKEQQKASKETPSTWTPMGAARQQLATDKAAVLQRMEQSITQCRISRSNRNFRLNSLGVFDQDINDVRSRSMHRVELHRGLSTTCMRGSATVRELRPVNAVETVDLRLERMYQKVLKSIDDNGVHAKGKYGRKRISLFGGNTSQKGLILPGADHERHRSSTGMGSITSRPPSDSGQLSMRRSMSGHRSQAVTPTGHSHSGPLNGLGSTSRVLDKQPSTSGSQVLSSAGQQQSYMGHAGAGGRHGSSAGHPQDMGMIGRSMSSNTQLRRSMSNVPFGHGPRGGGGQGGSLGGGIVAAGGGVSGGGGAGAKLDWTKLSLPPELLEAQLEHLAATTAVHLARYHAEVRDRQDELLARSGMDADALSCSPEVLQIRLQAQAELEARRAARMRSVAANAQGTGGSGMQDLKDVSLQLLSATTLPDLIQAALDHVGHMEAEYRALVGVKEPHAHFSKHRKHSTFKRSEQATAVDTPTRLSRGLPRPHPACSTANGVETEDSFTSEEDSEAWSDDEEGDTSGSGSSSGNSGSSGSGSDGDERGGAGDHQSSSRDKDKAREVVVDIRRPRRRRGWKHSRTRDPDRVYEKTSVSACRSGGSRPSLSSPASRPTPSPPPVPTEIRLAPMKVGQSYYTSDTGLDGTRGPRPILHPQRMAAIESALRAVAQESDRGRPREVKPLPPLPGNLGASAHMQARLARVWQLLQMPIVDRVDMVLRFTSHDMAFHIEGAVAAWEVGAAAVIAREATLARLLHFQNAVEVHDVSDLSVDAVQRVCESLLRLTAHTNACAAALMKECGCVLTFAGCPYPGDGAINQEHLLQFVQLLGDVSLRSGITE